MSDTSERHDVDALSIERADLRARNAELEQVQQASPLRRVGRVARSVAAVLLILLGVLCLVIAPLAVWGRNLVLNTDRYVETLTPVASDPGVQTAVINAVDRRVTPYLDVTSILAGTLPPRAVQALDGPLQGAVNGLSNTVITRFVQSDAFQTLWVEVNRLGHQQLTYVLTGKRPTNAAVKVSDNGDVVLDLAPVVQQVKTQLVAAGIGVASKIPAVGATVEIASVDGLPSARKAVRLLDQVANWLPWIGLALIAGGIATARKRRRALITAALGVGAGMIVIGVGLLIGRNLYLDQIPTDKLPRDTAGFIFDTLVRFLRLGIRLLLLLALLIALGAWVSGSSRPAVAIRRAVSSGTRAVTRRVNTGPVGRFVVRYTTALRVGIIALGLIILVLTSNPSLTTVIVLAVVVVVLLLVVELIRITGLRQREAYRCCRYSAQTTFANTDPTMTWPMMSSHARITAAIPNAP